MAGNLKAVPSGGNGGGNAPPPAGGAPPPPAKGQGWKTRLVRKKNGEPYADERNIWTALEFAPELHDLFQYDEFADRIEIRRPLPGMPRDELNKFFNDDKPITWADEHNTELVRWLTLNGFVYLRKAMVQDTVIAFAKRHAYHPVRAYLWEAEKAWDGKERLATWLKTYLGAKDHAAYCEIIGPKFLIGAIARVMEPGCQMDSILVLEGEQGKGKSTACRILGRHLWTRDITGDLTTKDAAVNIQNVWIGEMAELTALKRGDQEAVKGFISRRIDHYRPPYGRNSVDRARHSVFIATTNESDYLQDPTGARRIWPVECVGIDLAALERDADQLWGEAVVRYRAKVPWHLTEAEGRRVNLEQAPRQRTSEVDALVLEYAATMLEVRKKTIVMRDLLAEVFDVSPRVDPHKAGALAQQAGRALQREGWKALKPTWAGRVRSRTYEYIGLLDPEQNQGVGQGGGAKPNLPVTNAYPETTENDYSTQAPEAFPADSDDHSTQAPQADSGDSDEDIPF